MDLGPRWRWSWRRTLIRAKSETQTQENLRQALLSCKFDYFILTTYPRQSAGSAFFTGD
jgi:hypothetical protein